jgi:hypothetical protein
MSEKQAKADRQASNDVAARIEIRMYADGRVETDGPINNLMLFQHMMNLSERGVLDFLANQNAAKKSGIVIPALAQPDIRKLHA